MKANDTKTETIRAILRGLFLLIVLLLSFKDKLGRNLGIPTDRVL
jgi:hypothetical protein